VQLEIRRKVSPLDLMIFDMRKERVVVIGGGLSGLACALTLWKHNIPVTLLERENMLGGRVKTIRTSDGFTMDEGFQVLLASYPELSDFADLGALNLRFFNSGSLVYTGEELSCVANPLKHPDKLIGTLLSPIATLKDKALILKLILLSKLPMDDSLVGMVTTEQFLKDYGFSSRFIELFWRPFLTGVYLDPTLSPCMNYFKFLVRCFASGNIAIPENGMRELPRQMASKLPKDTVRLNCPVQSWSENGVELEGGEKIQATHVVCAFNPKAVTPSSLNSDFRSVTTYYFTSPKINDLNWGKWLILIPREFGFKLNHMCVLSTIAPSYAASGEALLSASVVGQATVNASDLIREINIIAKSDLNLRHLASVHVPHALPVLEAETHGFETHDGVIYCGDHCASPSINGALRSGRLAAESIVKKINL